MAARKQLPIAIPDITSYAHVAYVLSILHTDEDAMRWVYSNYVQLVIWDWETTVQLDFATQTAEEHLIPCIGGSQRMVRGAVNRFSPNFTDFVRFNIDEGFYVWVYVDDFYIPGTVAYQNRSNPHAILIHGYDDDTEEFYISGYFANQRYGSAAVSYRQIEQGYKAIVTDEWQPQNYIRLIRLNEAYKHLYPFRLEWFMEQLKEYLHAIPYDRRMRAFEEDRTWGLVWGVNIYGRLQEQVRRHMSQQGILDHRPFYVLWEHKKMMNRRISYMKESGYFAFSEQVFTGCRKIEQDALLIRNLELKYLLSFDNRFLEQIIERLGDLKQEETVVIDQMLDEYAVAGEKRGKQSERVNQKDSIPG